MVSNMPHKKILISVVVCTYNRAFLLENCLRSLEKQTADKKKYEVIVVNNNSTDNTLKFVQDFIKNRYNFRLITEKRQGLSYARNRGWKEAKGKYVAYIDDDAVAEPNWIEQIMIAIKKHPKISVFGGPYKRFFNEPIPYWFPENWGNLNLGSKEKILKQEWLSGSNIIFNKSILKKYGGFKTNLGMKGKKLLYGEETELLARFKKAGEPIYYVPTILVNHLVADYKLNFWWMLKSDYWRTFSYSLLNKNELDLFRGLYYLIASLFGFPAHLFNNFKYPFKRRLYYGLSQVFSALGRIMGAL